MALENWELFALFAVGCVAGFMNVLAGGGSLMTMPLMVFLGIPGVYANGTNRVAIFAQNVSATIGFFRQGFSDFKLSLSLLACALPGTLIGAWLGTGLRGRAFNWTLAVVMIAILVLMLWPKRSKKKQNAEERGQVCALAKAADYCMCANAIGRFLWRDYSGRRGLHLYGHLAPRVGFGSGAG